MIFLGASGIHGVGVFTDAPIPKSACPDLWHPDDLVFVDHFEIRGRVAKMAVYSLPDPQDAPGAKPPAAATPAQPAAAE